MVTAQMELVHISRMQAFRPSPVNSRSTIVPRPVAIFHASREVCSIDFELNGGLLAELDVIFFGRLLLKARSGVWPFGTASERCSADFPISDSTSPTYSRPILRASCQRWRCRFIWCCWYCAGFVVRSPHSQRQRSGIRRRRLHVFEPVCEAGQRDGCSCRSTFGRL